MTRIRAMSYNVRYANRNDHHDAWYARRDGVTDLVRFHAPDVVGFQEPLPDQRSDLRDRLPEYELVGRGRRVDDAGEGCPVAVRTDRWTIVDHDTFWLSETPDEPSTGWDASHPRIATWARVESRPATGTSQRRDRSSFVLINTHLDHRGSRAREEAARLLRRRIPELADAEREDSTHDPVVLLGDFNCIAESTPLSVLTDGNDDRSGPRLKDAAASAELRHGPTTSITDFTELIANRRIDHVLVSPAIEVAAFATLADRDDRGRYPSDHLPVLAGLDL
ncbi:endonuclease/exonuclease/phosphatase family protein [Halorubrum luteum]